jgi:MFS family permease
MLNDIGISFFIVTIFLVVDSIARIYGMSIWGKLGDRLGAKGMLVFGATISSTTPLLFVFITRSNYLLIIPIFLISAFAYAAVDVSLSQLLFKLTPRKDDAIFLTSFYMISGLSAGIGPILGGFLAFFVEKLNFSFSSLFFVFALSFLLRIAALPWIRKIEERDARDINDVKDNIRAIRVISFVTNYYDIASLISRLVLLSQQQLIIIQKKAYLNLKESIKKSIVLSRKARIAIGRSNISMIKTISKEFHELLSGLDIPRRYSEYRAIREMEKDLDELAKPSKFTKKNIEHTKQHIIKGKRVLDNFFEKILKRGKRIKE